jgi:hypothetical protein
MRNMFRNLAPDLHNPARRKLLRSAALLLVLVSTSLRGLVARAKADSGAAIQEQLAETLGQMARRLFPHDVLSAEPYEEIATALVSRASTDSKLAEVLKGGVVQLDEGSSTPWLMQTEARQIAAIRRIQGGEFFRLIRTTTIEHLYRNKEVWQLLGYQGSSIEFGGYVDRGFDDIDWLPGESKTQ